jgi:hypothetical protein
MEERAAREARKRAAEAEAEAIAREKARLAAEQQQQLRLEEQSRRERAAQAQAVGQGGGGNGGISNISGGGGIAGDRDSGDRTAQQQQRISDNSQKTNRTSGGTRIPSGELHARGTGGAALGGGGTVDPAQARRAARAAQAGISGGGIGGQQHTQPTPQHPIKEPRDNPPPQSYERAHDPHLSSSTKRQTGSTFPHAFERWETLSSHWEGLTSYWIRRLEENAQALNQDPISQQLARQVTDLSAAGANLFHAVVELQRLRASSERKFQRWFFDTRTEQERSLEREGMLERELRAEREGRERAIQEAVQKAVEASVKERRESEMEERRMTEMRRELEISKQEARRAWEELGRREAEEAERMQKLREGVAVMVGGVQVVPTMGGAPSRHTSRSQGGHAATDPERPVAREGPYPGGPTESRMGGQQSPSAEEQAYYQNVRARQAQEAQQAQDYSDPFFPPSTTQSHPSQHPGQVPASSAAPTTTARYPPIPVSSSAPGGYYPNAPVPAQSGGAAQSDDGSLSDGEYIVDEHGNFLLDAQGNKVPYQASNPDEESDSENGYPGGQGQGGGGYAPGTSAGGAGYIPATSGGGGAVPGEYEGEGYRWSQHHRPTRLSDVLEEDERSRTTASQVSRAD